MVAMRFDGRFIAGHLPNSDDFFFSGSGTAFIAVEKGSIFEKCVTVPLVGQRCALFPTESTKALPLASAGLGLFQNGDYGVKGDITIPGVSVGGVDIWSDFRIGAFYNFDTNDLKFGDVSQYQLYTPARLQQARGAWEKIQAGYANFSALDRDTTFASDGTILVDVDVPALTTYEATSTSPPVSIHTTEPVTVTLRSDVIFLFSQDASSPWEVWLQDPSGSLITPDTLPEGIGYGETISGNTAQITYFVTSAEPGQWQVVLDGPANDSDFVLAVFGNDPAPVVDEVTAVQGVNPDNLTLSFDVTASEVMAYSVFANPGEVTTDGDNPDTMPLYSGISLIKEWSTGSISSGNVMIEDIDLSRLPSGSYAIWLEGVPDRAPFTPVRSYALSSSGEPLRLEIDHSSTFPQNWTTDPETMVDLSNQTLNLSWSQLDHPDVAGYTVKLLSADPLEPEIEITRTISVALTSDPQAQILIDNIEPGQTYTLTIGAQMIGNQQIAWSQEFAVTMPQPDFILTSEVTSPQLTVCGGSIPLTLTMSDNMPYPVIMDVARDRLPDGVYIEYDREVVSESSEVEARITFTNSILPGYYALPFSAYSGLLNHELTLSVEIIPAETPCYQILLPLVVNGQ
jgi:hypothetical protein